jgi:bacterioferritin
MKEFDKVAPALAQMLNTLIGQFWDGMIRHQTHLQLVRSWGLNRVAKEMEAHIADEPVTLQQLTARLLELGETPAIQLSAPSFAGDIKALLDLDLVQQRSARPVLNAAAEQAAAAHDATTRNLIEKILADEEEHLAWLEKEQQLLEKLGEALYFASSLS